MKIRILVALLAALGNSACISTNFSFSSSSSSSGHELNEIETEDGQTHRYVLHYGSNGSPAVNRTVERRFEVARFGVNVRSIDGKLAESLMTDAWSGVLIDFVAKGSAAAKAELERGDILLEVGGVKLTNREHFIEVVEGDLQPGVETTILVASGSAETGRERSERQLVPGVREVSETMTDTIELEAPVAIEERTGMQLVTIPEDLALKVWESDEPRVYVSGVVVGSTAYLSGIRGGDRLLRCNGKSVSSAEEVALAIGGEPGTHQFTVVGKQGEFVASTKTVRARRRRSRFKIPIIVDYSSSTRRKRISFLDFIFQFGFNYRGEYLRTSSREPARNTHLSILPLGMFEFDRTPTSSRNTIFWFITWRTGH